MGQSINNLKNATVNTFTAATTTIAVSAKLLADTTSVLNKSIAASPEVAKTVLRSPFDATTGYLMESEGIDEASAKKRAYKYLDQDVSRTIEEMNMGAGKLFAELLKDEPVNDNNDNTQEK